VLQIKRTVQRYLRSGEVEMVEYEEYEQESA
jgi:hypothetical protein